MRWRWMLGLGAGLATNASLATADTAPSPSRSAPPAYGEGEIRNAPPEYVAEPAPPAPPLGRLGFQLAVRSGISMPFGSAKDDRIDEAARPEHWSSSMGDLSGIQIPLTIDIGGKPNKHVFIGAYLSYARGVTAGRLGEACARIPLDCHSTNVRFGAQIHYVFAPDEWLTPWVGYGFGYAWLSAGDGPRDVYLRGFDIAHALGGIDVRFSRTLALGVVVDGAIGIYGHHELAADPPTSPGVDGSVGGRAMHQWLTLGPRLVVMP